MLLSTQQGGGQPSRQRLTQPPNDNNANVEKPPSKPSFPTISEGRCRLPEHPSDMEERSPFLCLSHELAHGSKSEESQIIHRSLHLRER